MQWEFAKKRIKRRTAFIVLAGLFLLIGAVFVSDRIAERRVINAETARLNSVARLTASSYQRQVDKFRLVATTLSSDSDVSALLDTGSTMAVKKLNERLANLNVALDASVIYLLDDQGKTVASSNWQQTDSFMGESYQFRAYFKQALGAGQWEQYALGTRSRIPGLFVARRVVTAKKARGVIVVKIRFDRLEREWANSAGLTFVTSKQGVILVSSVPTWRFQTIRKLGEAEQNQFRTQVEFGDTRLRQNSLFERELVTDGTKSLRRETKYISAKDALPNGLSVYVIAPLDQALDSTRAVGRLIVLVVAGLVLAITILSIFRRRAIVAAEQRENANRIADLKDRLVQANKLSSLGQMAAGIGHEINQPLTAIGIRAQNARKLIENGRAVEAATVVAEISALIARVGAITQELRRFARRGNGRQGRISLQAVLNGTQLLLGDRIRTTATSLHINTVEVSVVGDQGGLEQVFVNLLQNSMDAMGDGGRIDIGVKLHGPVVSIKVSDSGPGIAPDLTERLFQPFNTSKDDGLGLGLVICRDIITEFGGELNMVPSPIGAIFVITLRAAS